MPQSDQTRQRLLDAALLIFSERGFKSASVREICTLAQANNAAIHYHFGDKAGLYRSVFERHAHDFSDATTAFERLPAKEAFRAYYKGILSPLLGCRQARAIAKLYAREEYEPTGLLQSVRQTETRPAHDRVVAFLERELGQPTVRERITRLALSLAGMASIYIASASGVEELAPALLSSPQALGDLVEQLTDQALALLAHHRGVRDASNVS